MQLGLSMSRIASDNNCVQEKASSEMKAEIKALEGAVSELGVNIKEIKEIISNRSPTKKRRDSKK